MGDLLYIIVPIVAWVVSQGAKYIYAAMREKSIKVFSNIYMSGNMPSAHSATVFSLTTIIGLKEGVTTSIFAVALILSVIVMYDAMMVRRAVGEQGEYIKKIINNSSSKITKQPFFAKGHKPIEVAVGAIIGATVAIVVFIATK